MRYLGALLVLGLTVYALIDCLRTDQAQVRSLPKALWLAVVFFVPLVGPVAWVVAGRERGGPPRPAPAGPVAPDDDPTFLRRLDAERRREERERRSGSRPPAEPDGPAAHRPGHEPGTDDTPPQDAPDDDDGTAGVR